jgi:hypothetical protein
VSIMLIKTFAYMVFIKDICSVIIGDHVCESQKKRELQISADRADLS